MINHYTLVSTGKTLPGFAPEAVWSRLAETFRIAPDKRQQLQARALQIIKRASDPDELQTLEACTTQIGAQAELYPSDERPEPFVMSAAARPGIKRAGGAIFGARRVTDRVDPRRLRWLDRAAALP